MPPATPAGPPLRAVLFDLDDTLFDHLGTARAALTATQQQYPALHGLGLDELSARYGELLEELHLQLLAGRLTVAEARQQRFERLLAPYGVSAAAAGGIGESHYAHYRRLRRVLPGAAELLQALAPDYQLGIVSNNRLAEQQDKLQQLGLRALLPVLVTPEEAGAAKPAPRIFEVALARLGVGPAEAVLVGDSWPADVVGALAAGIRPVWLNRTGAVAPQPGVAELRSLQPLAHALAVITGRATLPAG